MADITINGLTFEPFISREQIAENIRRVAAQVRQDCATPDPLFLCVLNGAFVFAADFLRAVDMPLSEITFIRFKSYEGTSSTGVVKEIMGLNDNLEGREVIIIEDIVDTGVRELHLRDTLVSQNPDSVQMVSLLFKPASLKVGQAPEYVCFEIPSRFILGYGLDIDGAARGLDEIYVLKENN